MSDYQKRFNKIYRNSYDVPSWSHYPISKDIIGFINTLLSKGILKRDSPILDAGCGRGRLLVELEKLGFINTTGVDISDVAVKYAKSQTKSSNVLEADIIKGLSFPNNSFDLIVDLTMVSSCHPNLWSEIYQKFNRLLKCDGQMISEIFIRPINTPLGQPLTKKNIKIPDDLDLIYGITNKEIETIMGHFFNITEIHKSRPDSQERYSILAKKR